MLQLHFLFLKNFFSNSAEEAFLEFKKDYVIVSKLFEDIYIYFLIDFDRF